MNKILVFFCLLSISVFGQIKFPLHFNVSTLNGDDGLSQVSNYFRYEDSQGFMWITANDALNRYDGSSVKVYNLNKYFNKCPNLQQAYGFAEDSESNLYLGSEKGLYIYNRKTDRFSLQKIFKNSIDDIAMPFAFENGKIWCFNRFYEIATYDVNTKQINLITKVELETINSVHIYQMQNNVFYYRWPFIDANKNIWIIGMHKVAKYDIKTKKLSYPIQTLKSNIQNEFYCSTFDSKNGVLMIGTNRGLFEYNTISQKNKLILNLGNKPLGIINSLAIKNKLVALKSNEEFVLYYSETQNHQWIWPNDFSKTRAIIYFTFDKIGRLWTTDNGLEQKIFDFKGSLLKKIPEEIDPGFKSNSNSVGYIVELPSHEILIHGNWILNNANGNVKKINFLQTYTRVATDFKRNGFWLINSINKNRIVFVDKNFKIHNFLPSNDIDKLGEIQDLVVFESGKILLSSSNGLYWIDPNHNTIAKANSTPNAFKINLINQSTIIVSFLNQDLIEFQIKNDKLIEKRHIMKGTQSFYVQFDTLRKRYWIGTNKGVFLLNEQYKIIKQFDANNGLSGTYIYGLLLDNEGNAWCSHQRGLSSINTSDFSIVNFDKSDGIQDWDFNNRAYLKGSDGTLYFGGVNGINYFKPPLKQIKYYKSEVYIDEIWVKENPFMPEINANEVKDIQLSFQENSISFKVFVKDLEYGKSQQIIYRLIQKQKTKWNILPQNSKLIFNNLASGNYVLELGVYDKFSKEKIASKLIAISIATPFYNHIFFWLLIGFFTAGLAFYIYNRQKTRKLNAIFEQELALEKQRTKITADLHDDIGSSLSSLQVNSVVASKLLTQDVKKAKTVLEKIEHQSKQLGETLGDLIWSLKPGKEEVIDFATKIKNFANDILGSTDIDYKIKIDTNIKPYLQEIYLRKNLIYIAKEAINNSAKYSNASEFSLNSYYKNGSLYLEINDNGNGFDIETVQGNGIKNIRMRVSEMKGIIEIITKENEGCQILIAIPLSLELGTK